MPSASRELRVGISWTLSDTFAGVTRKANTNRWSALQTTESRYPKNAWSLAAQYPMRASGSAGAFASLSVPEKKRERVVLVIVALGVEKRHQLPHQRLHPLG